MWNKNRTKQDFGYTLQVTDNDYGASYLPLDPGGTNENGSFKSNLATIAVTLLGGAAVGSLLTLGIQSMMGS